MVFMDTDILVVDDLAAAFCQEFDYALTLSDAVDMPINIGMQVQGGLPAVQLTFPCVADSLAGHAFKLAGKAGAACLLCKQSWAWQPPCCAMCPL